MYNFEHFLYFKDILKVQKLLLRFIKHCLIENDFPSKCPVVNIFFCTVTFNLYSLQTKPILIRNSLKKNFFRNLSDLPIFKWQQILCKIWNTFNEASFLFSRYFSVFSSLKAITASLSSGLISYQTFCKIRKVTFVVKPLESR